jgi:hypothetical protein
MRKLAIALALCATMLPMAPASADPAAAKTCLDSLISGAVANGMRVRGWDGDAAGAEESVTYRLTLYKGMTYVLLGCADGQGVDLDLKLYDDQGVLVDSDKSPDAQPFVSVEPGKTGEYALQVSVYKGTGKTDFAVGIAYQY